MNKGLTLFILLLMGVVILKSVVFPPTVMAACNTFPFMSKLDHLAHRIRKPPREYFIRYIGKPSPQRYFHFYYKVDDCNILWNLQIDDWSRILKPHPRNPWQVQPGDVFFVMDAYTDRIVLESIDGYCSSPMHPNFLNSYEWECLPTESDPKLNAIRQKMTKEE